MTEPPVPRYGVREATAAAGELDVHAEEIRLLGHTVLDSGLDAAAVADLRGRIDPVIAQQEQEFGGPGALARIGDADTGRAMLAYDEAFLGLATNPRLLGLVERLLGAVFLLSQQNAIVLRPQRDHGQARYHRDLPWQHFTSSRPLALNALFCADAFTAENGATRVIPASHRQEPFPSDPLVRRVERVITAPAGAFIVLDAMLFHSGGHNTTAAPRRAVNHVFVLPFMRQQVDLPAMLGGRHAEDPLLRRLLGYDSRTPASVRDWRAGRPGGS